MLAGLTVRTHSDWLYGTVATFISGRPTELEAAGSILLTFLAIIVGPDYYRSNVTL